MSTNVMKFTANVQLTSLVRYFRRVDDERGSISSQILDGIIQQNMADHMCTVANT